MQKAQSRLSGLQYWGGDYESTGELEEGVAMSEQSPSQMWWNGTTMDIHTLQGVSTTHEPPMIQSVSVPGRVLRPARRMKSVDLNNGGDGEKHSRRKRGICSLVSFLCDDEQPDIYSKGVSKVYKSVPYSRQPGSHGEKRFDPPRVLSKDEFLEWMDESGEKQAPDVYCLQVG